MSFIVPSKSEVVKLKLARDHSRRIKQGYPWVYDQWLVELPVAKPGSRAMVRDRDGALFAFGMYDPNSPLAVRVCALESEQLSDDLILQRLEAALELRRQLFDSATTGYRLINGEGDGLPGLVCDIYATHAVFRPDGAGPAGFWNFEAITEWLCSKIKLSCVHLKSRSAADDTNQQASRLLFGDLGQAQAVVFLENGLKFQADLIKGQKSGFFFDQRDNRLRFSKLLKGKSLLNLFGYTGGFSVYAGSTATSVTTVDLAKPAIQMAEINWSLNKFNPELHQAVAADAFEYLEKAKHAGREWQAIVVDPPSFASAERQVEKGKEAYERVFAMALSVLAPGGVIAFSSCSSHISSTIFSEICQKAFSKARRRARAIGLYGQPEDHPFPFACPELQYLKFFTFKS